MQIKTIRVNIHRDKSKKWRKKKVIGCISRNDVDLSSELFLKKVEKLINFWAPPQKVSNKQKKLLNKPWLTSGILKSIEIKNRLHKRMCRAKYPLHEDELGNKVKNYRNTILKLRQTTSTNFSMITNWIYSKHGRESGKS